MRIATMATLAACALVSDLDGQVSGPVGARLDSALIAAAAAGFSGVVRVDQGGTTVLEKGYGLANRADAIPFSSESVVQIGSNTKDFTVVALLQLQERGRLNVTDSLGKFFPSAPADKRAITLWQLVIHRAGFPIGLGGDFEPVGRQELVDRAMARPLSFPPGSRESYSNTGYSLLAAIIERVSGTTYDAYVNENILRPLGMRSTGFLLPAFDTRRLAHGYRAGIDQGTMLSRPHAADGPYWNLRGNGGMLSTAADMHTFYTALFDSEQLLTAATRALRFNRDEPIGLAGSDLVCSFLYERLPGRKLEIIVASNTSEWSERRARDVIARVLGLPSPNGSPATVVAKTNVRPPAPGVAAMLTGFIAAVNSGDQARIRASIADHFTSDAASPPIEVRIERMMTMHGNLGELTIVTQNQVEAGVVELSLKSSTEGAVTIRVQIDEPSGKVRGLQVMVGG